MKAIYRLTVALAACAMVSTGVLGCNTFRGAGKDIKRGGEAIENAADNVQNNRTNRDARDQTILASAEWGGSISPSGSTRNPYGSNQTFAVDAHTGYQVEDVRVDGRSIGAVNRHTFENVTGSHSISATFSRIPTR